MNIPDSIAVEAHLMRVSEVFSQAKWLKEKTVYHADQQKAASQTFATAASTARRDDVLAVAVPAERLAFEQARYEALIDKALWYAARTAHNALDFDMAQSYLQQIVGRSNDLSLTDRAQAWIMAIDERQTLGGRQ